MKEPQTTRPAERGVTGNGKQTGREYELIDTATFNVGRHFHFRRIYQVFSEDILVRISVVNRGPAPGISYVLPHLRFRNIWWQRSGAPIPRLTAMLEYADASVMHGVEEMCAPPVATDL